MARGIHGGRGALGAVSARLLLGPLLPRRSLPYGLAAALSALEQLAELGLERVLY